MSTDQDSPPPSHNIAMWGAPTSGKTTFITALDIALTRRGCEWGVVGVDDASTDFLIEATAKLSEEHEFFEATDQLYSYRWNLIRQSPGATRRKFWGKAGKDALRVGLDLLDPPGGVYKTNVQTYAGMREELLANLTKCRGIVLLFDPIREFEDGDTFSSLHGTLARLGQRMLATGDFPDGKLPHHLAVCITKFDELRVLRTAQRLGVVTTDPDDKYEFPRVDDENALELFRELCNISASGNAEMVLTALERNFHTDRIKYFVTSSIGFNVDSRSGVYDPADPQNLIPKSAAGRSPGGSSGQYRIRGQIHPINVMEPMTWLAERLSEQSPAGGGKR